MTLLSVPGDIRGQIADTAPKAASIRITFLPPPLEGTISAGVYTPDGRLVRTLAREATEGDFTVGLNGLIVQWDGKSDAGKPLPAGKYFVRGYAVGVIDVQGVAFHGNEWLSEDDKVPRIVDIVAMEISGPELLLVGRGLGSTDCIVHLSRESREMTFDPYEREAISGGGPTPRFSSPAAKELAVKSISLKKAADPAPSPGTGGTIWTIVPESTGTSLGGRVLQRSADGKEVLRELDFESGQPQPSAVVAAPDREEIYLLERGEKEIRVRGLRLQKTQNDSSGKAVSEWELFLSKSIQVVSSFEQFASYLKRTPPPRIADKVRVSLIPNELIPVAPAALQIGVSRDEKGSFLHNSDGLLLRRVTDTEHLQWAVLTTEPDGSISLFQGDGAAVEEYRLRHLDQIMAFDAGEYDLPAAK